MNFCTLAEELLTQMNRMRKLKAEGKISEGLQGEAFVLEYLSQKQDEVIPREISSEMGISTARITVVLNNLEKKEYITREIDKSDRRRVLVNLTESGKAAAAQLRKTIISNLTRALELLGESDAREYVRIMRKLTFC